jgi:hypothetical protein
MRNMEYKYKKNKTKKKECQRFLEGYDALTWTIERTKKKHEEKMKQRND